jgi:phospholipase/lecithinase/hemolysin
MIGYRGRFSGLVGGVTALAVLALGGCGSEPPVFSGSGPFARVVYMGDSLTAGFQNGSLLDRQQVNGFANLVAKQADYSVTLPLIAPPGAPAVLQLVSAGFPPVVQQTPGITTGRDNPNTPATDLAVPGHTLHDLIYYAPTLTPTTDEDIITDLVLGIPTGDANTQLAQAVKFNPSTVFLWAGSEDALLADDAGSPSAMTPLASFETDYTFLISTLKARTSAHLVVANIPDVTAVPYMTPAAVVISEIVQATGLPAVVVEGELGIAPGDLINANGLSDLEAEVAAVAKGAPPTPLPGSDVLTAAEIVTVQNTINSYNQVIAQQVAAAGGTLVDLHSYIASISSGITINGYTANASFLGGLFGLDGIHPTNTAQALLANQFIAATNTAFGLSTPSVNVSAVAAKDPYFPPNIPASSAMVRIPTSAAKQANQMMEASKTKASVK